MSYNGIGLQTAKGSSTNGFIQKNYTRSVETNYQRRLKNKQDDQKKDKLIQVVKDKELVQHEDRRKIELQISEYRDILEDEGRLNDDEIDEKCKELRESLLHPKPHGYKRREERQQQVEKPKELDY